MKLSERFRYKDIKIDLGQIKFYKIMLKICQCNLKNVQMNYHEIILQKQIVIDIERIKDIKYLVEFK